MNGIEIGFLSPTKHKHQFQLTKYVKYEKQNFNTFRTKYENSFSTLKFFKQDTQKLMKERVDKFDYFKIKMSSKNTLKQMKNQVTL